MMSGVLVRGVGGWRVEMDGGRWSVVEVVDAGEGVDSGGLG